MEAFFSLWNIERESFPEMIRQFEKRFGCYVALHDFTGDISAVLAPELSELHHTNPHCELIRSKSEADYRLCLECDEEKIRSRIFARNMFWKECHAGFRELVIPVTQFDSVVGVFFVGIFAPLDTLSPVQASLPEAPEDLPVFASLLAGELCRLLERAPVAGSSPLKNRIRVWFVHHFREPEIGRRDLAGAMNLSESRICQVLREEFHRTFPALLNDHRLHCARQILEHSTLPLDEVARFSGFRSANYLHRSFKRQFRMTPTDYRKRVSGAEPGVGKVVSAGEETFRPAR